MVGGGSRPVFRDDERNGPMDHDDQRTMGGETGAGAVCKRRRWRSVSGSTGGSVSQSQSAVCDLVWSVCQAVCERSDSSARHWCSPGVFDFAPCHRDPVLPCARPKGREREGERAREKRRRWTTTSIAPPLRRGKRQQSSSSSGGDSEILSRGWRTRKTTAPTACSSSKGSRSS